MDYDNNKINSLSGLIQSEAKRCLENKDVKKRILGGVKDIIFDNPNSFVQIGEFFEDYIYYELENRYEETEIKELEKKVELIFQNGQEIEQMNVLSGKLEYLRLELNQIELVLDKPNFSEAANELQQRRQEVERAIDESEKLLDSISYRLSGEGEYISNEIEKQAEEQAKQEEKDLLKSLFEGEIMLIEKIKEEEDSMIECKTHDVIHKIILKLADKFSEEIFRSGEIKYYIGKEVEKFKKNTNFDNFILKLI